MGRPNRGAFRGWSAAGLSAVLLACGGGGGGGGDGNGTGVQVGSVSGSVVNESQASAGVANVPVTLARSGSQNRNTTTNSAGAFSFTSVETGAATVEISVPSGLELAANETGTRSVTVVANQTAQVSVFRLRVPAPTTGTISGRVTAAGSAVAGATVTGSGNLGARQTNSSGNYSFTGVAPGGYTVTLTVPGGFALAAGETASKSATVVAGQTFTVDWSLQQSGTATNAVDARDDFFSPVAITVSAGTTVTWTNRGQNTHTITSDTGLFNSGDRTPNQTFARTFSQAGTFHYHCTFHGSAGTGGQRGSGMAGTVIVQ